MKFHPITLRFHEIVQLYGELAGRRMTRQSCLLTEPQVRRLTLSAGCSEWERRLKPQLRTLVRVRVRVSSQPRRSRHSSPPPSSPPPLPPSRLHLASISPPSASRPRLSPPSAISPPPRLRLLSRLRLRLASSSPPSRFRLASVSPTSHLASISPRFRGSALLR